MLVLTRILLIVAMLTGLLISVIGRFGFVLQGGSALDFYGTMISNDVYQILDPAKFVVVGDVRTGDEMRARSSLLALRMSAVVGPATQSFINLRTGKRVVLADKHRSLSVINPFRFPLKYASIVLQVIALSLLIFRGKQRSALALAVLLFLIGFSSIAGTGYWLGAGFALAYAIAQPVMFAAVPQALVFFATSMIPRTITRQLLQWLAYALGILTACIVIYGGSSVRVGTECTMQQCKIVCSF